jgi:hypothetical protein
MNLRLYVNFAKVKGVHPVKTPVNICNVKSAVYSMITRLNLKSHRNWPGFAGIVSWKL